MFIATKEQAERRTEKEKITKMTVWQPEILSMFTN